MKKLVVFFFIIGGLILAVFISNKKDKFLINNNALISYYVESESGTGVYEKQDGTTWPDGYVLNEEKSTCDNGSILSWDSSTNSVVVTASKEDSCRIYMDVKSAILLADYVETLLASNPNTMNNDDPDGNIRYMGANPNNYVTFNNELWRMIGVFDVKSTANGKAEKRVKLIRADSIGSYSWDSSEASINNGYGINEWSQADIMITLNSGAYWNRTSGTCYSGSKNSTMTCDFSNNGLMDSSKNLIENAVWSVGTIERNWDSSYVTTITSDFYNAERSNNVGKTCTGGTYCNDTVSRATTWIGQVGLMYPSDYGYATSGGNTYSRGACLKVALYNWSNSTYNDCISNDWLYSLSGNQWTITPTPYSSYSSYVFFVPSSGLVNRNVASGASRIRPVVYLKASVKIIGGEGTSTSPYQLRA